MSPVANAYAMSASGFRIFFIGSLGRTSLLRTKTCRRRKSQCAEGRLVCPSNFHHGAGHGGTNAVVFTPRQSSGCPEQRRRAGLSLRVLPPSLKLRRATVASREGGRILRGRS